MAMYKHKIKEYLLNTLENISYTHTIKLTGLGF